MIYKAQLIKIFAKKNAWFSGLVDIGDRTVKITGYNNSEHVLKNRMCLVIDGDIIHDVTYGDSLKASKIDFIIDDPFYLFLSTFIKSSTKKKIERTLIKYSQSEITNWFDTENYLMLELNLKGSKKSSVDLMLKSWIDNKDVFEFFKLFSLDNDLNISNTQINKIYKYFSEKNFNIIYIVKSIKDNPYLLLEVPDFGFKLVDKIALSLGIDKYDDRRIQEFIQYRMREMSEFEGNTVFTIKTLMKDLEYNIVDLDIPFKQFKFLSMLKINVELGNIIIKKDSSDIEYMILKDYYKYEEFILENLKKRSASRLNPIIDNKTIDNLILNFEKLENITLTDLQRQFLPIVNNNNVSMLQGYAGAGKSFISKLTLNLFVDSMYCKKDDIITCALSAVAARKIGEYTGFNYRTIHSMLYDKSLKNSGKLPYKVYLIDELSMVNSKLLYDLLSIIGKRATIIFVGDRAQLPPVGPGEPFEDILNRHLIPTIELTEVKRSNNNTLNDLTKSIRKGIVTEYDNIEGFTFNNTNNLDETTILKDVKSHIKPDLDIMYDFFKSSDYINYLYYSQIIIPKKRGLLGTNNVNKEIQCLSKIDIDSVSFKNYGDEYKYSVGDKVIHLLNEKMPTLNCNNLNIDLNDSLAIKTICEPEFSDEVKVFNGMVGLVAYISTCKEYITVYYPLDNLLVQYNIAQLKNSKILDLAYVITTHKSQGSGYSNITYIQQGNYPHTFYNRKMLYTALTRYKEKCTLFITKTDYVKTIEHDNLSRKTVMKLL